MKITGWSAELNSGAVFDETYTNGTEISWPGEHWAQDPNRIQTNSIRMEEDGKVQTDISMEWMAFHKIMSFREMDSIRISIKIEENIKGILYFSMFNDWWTRPYFPESLCDLPDNGTMVVLQTENDYIGIMALPGKVFHTRISAGHEKDSLCLVMSANASGYTNISETAALWMRSADPYRCIEELMKKACSLYEIPLREQRSFPAVFEKMGWCSWDAFYQDVSECGLLDKAREIKEKKLPFGWMLIDDGWLTARDKMLSAFEADKKKFPDGLASCVNKIREICSVEKIGVWHAFSGYWGGIDPDGKLSQEFDRELFLTRQRRLLLKPEKSGAFHFFSSWYRFLRECGIDFVKVDSQSSLNSHYSGNAPIGESASELNGALDDAAEAHMNGNLINCMGMAPESLLNRPKSAISRNSDDFVPLRENGFEEHLLQNAYNSLYHNMVYYGDWDMFWSSHPDAKKHAVLRALSGGPVYVSDPVGKTERNVLMPLCYEDGSLLRVSKAAVPTEDCLFRDPWKQGYLKLKNNFKGTGYLAVFPFGKCAASIDVCIRDIFPDAEATGRYCVYDTISGEGACIDSDGKWTVELMPEEYALWQIRPVNRKIAFFGLKEKVVSSHAVLDEKYVDEELVIRILEGGKCLFYSEDKSPVVYCDGLKAEAAAIGRGFYTVDIEVSEGIHEIRIK